MLTNKVNNALNGTLAVAMKELNLDETEKLFLQMNIAKTMPEKFLDTELIMGLLDHAELLFARELKKRYDKISESN